MGDNQLEMTRFQKQVLVAEEKRQSEQAQQNGELGSESPSGPLNARHPKVGNSGNGYTETIRYKNERETSSENELEVIS